MKQENPFILQLKILLRFSHSEHFGGVNLVFDLIEEFRQQIVDKTVLSIVKKNQVSLDDFEDKGNMIFLSDKSGRLVIAKILDKLNGKTSFMMVRCLIQTLFYTKVGEWPSS